jgi:hypothetical protein
MGKVKPIKPEQMNDIIPDWVIEGANKCIVDHYSKGESQFTQNELIKYILEEMPPEVSKQHDVQTKRQMLFDYHLLDIEDTYREAGWKVEYDKPAYCEDYPANFTFRVPLKTND